MLPSAVLAYVCVIVMLRCGGLWKRAPQWRSYAAFFLICISLVASPQP